MKKLHVIAMLSVLAALPTGLAAQDKVKDGPGKDVFLLRCSACHQADSVTSQQHSKTEWNEIVGHMIDNGAVVPDADRAVIVDYLAKNYGTAEEAKAPAAKQ